MYRLKTRYYLELLTPETTKLLGTNKSKKNKVENGENVLRLKITKVALDHCNIVKKDYQHNSRVLCTFVPNKLYRYFA